MTENRYPSGVRCAREILDRSVAIRQLLDEQEVAQRYCCEEIGFSAWQNANNILPEDRRCLPMITSAKGEKEQPVSCRKLRLIPTSMATFSSPTTQYVQNGENPFLADFLRELATNPSLLDDVEEEISLSFSEISCDPVRGNLGHLTSAEFNINVICFNSSQELKHCQAGLLAESEMTKSNINRIKTTLSALLFAGASSPSTISSPVFFVGTHSDEVKESLGVSIEERMAEVSKELQNSLKDFGSYGFMEGDAKVSVYLVNSAGERVSPEIEKVAQDIANASLCFVHSPSSTIPRKWLRFEWVLRHLTEVQQSSLNGIACTTREVIRVLAQRFCCITMPSELEAMLQFYHRMCLIVYRPRGRHLSVSPSTCIIGQPDELVIFDPQWFIDQVSEVISGSSIATSPCNQYLLELRRFLADTGRLYSSLLKSVCGDDDGHCQVLIASMRRCDLLYSHDSGVVDSSSQESEDRKRPADDLNQLVFYMPLAVTRQSNGNLVEMLDISRRSSLVFSTSEMPLVISLPVQPTLRGRNHLPAPMPRAAFYRLVVKMMHAWNVKSLEEDDVQLFTTCAWLPATPCHVGLDGSEALHVCILLYLLEPAGAVLANVDLYSKSEYTPVHPQHLNSVVCNRVREQISRAVGELLESSSLDGTSSKLGQAILPLPPICGCSIDDVGQAKWKIDNTTWKQPGSPQRQCHGCSQLVSTPISTPHWFRTKDPSKLHHTKITKAARFLRSSFH